MRSHALGIVALPLLELGLVACGSYGPGLDPGVAIGRLALLQDRPEEALRFLEAATATDAGSASAYFWYGQALEEMGRFDVASTAYAQALRLEDAPAHRVRVAVLAARLGEPGRAISLLRSALRAPSRLRTPAGVALDRIAHRPSGRVLRWLLHDEAGESLLRILVETGDDAAARALADERGWVRPAAVYCGGTLPDLSDEGQVVLAMLLAPAEATCLYDAGVSLLEEGQLRLARRLLGVAAEHARTEAERVRIRAFLHHRVPTRPVPPRAEALVAAGLRLETRYRLPDEARTAYTAALAIDPSFSWAALGLASLMEDGDDSEKALTWYQRAAEADTEDSLAQLGIGRTAYDLRRYELSAQAYRRATELDPSSAPAFAGLGEALGKLHRNADAVGALEAALRRDPNQRDAARLLAERRGTFDAVRGGAGAGGALAQARGLQDAGRWNEAGAAARHAAAVEPRSPYTQMAAADLLEEGGDVEGARRLHAVAESLEPGSIGVLEAGSSFALRVGQPDRALALSDRLASREPWFAATMTRLLPELGRRVFVRQHPALTRAADLRVDVLLDSGRIDEARALAHRYAVVRSSVDYCARARAQIGAADRDVLYRAFRSAALGQPQQAECVWWFGQWLTDEGQVRLARTMVVEARRATPIQTHKDSADRYLRIRLSGGREVSKAAEHLVLLARRRIDQGDSAQARRLLTEAQRRDPGYVSPYNLLARLDWEAGDTASAITRLQQALAIDAESWRTHRNLGLLLAELEQRTEAEAHLRRTLELFRDDVGARVALARVLYAQGKFGAYASETRAALAAGAAAGQPLPEVRTFLDEFERRGARRTLPPSRLPRIALGWNAD